MLPPGSIIPPEESTITDELHVDVIKKQVLRRKRTLGTLIALGVTAGLIGAMIGWLAMAR